MDQRWSACRNSGGCDGYRFGRRKSDENRGQYEAVNDECVLYQEILIEALAVRGSLLLMARHRTEGFGTGRSAHRHHQKENCDGGNDRWGFHVSKYTSWYLIVVVQRLELHQGVYVNTSSAARARC